MASVATLFPQGTGSTLADTPEEQEAVQAVARLGGRRVLWLEDPNTDTTTFVAPNPEAALRWICHATSKKAIIQFLEQLRKHAREEGSSADDATDADAEGAADNELTSANRKRRAEKKKEQEAKEVYRDAWHNSQELVRKRRDEEAFTEERASWLAYASEQPESQGVGSSVMSEMIRRATTVGNSEAVQDLQLALRHWRQRHAEPTLALSQASQTTAPGTIRSLRRQARARGSHPDVLARYHYLRVEDAEQMGAGLAVERRFHAARLRKEYDARLEEALGPKASSRISKRVVSHVQETFFRVVCPRGQPAKGDRDFEKFLRTLKHGKRWLRMEEDFGCGIFALLPKSRVSNTYVERTLTDELFLLWVRILHHCSELVVRMAEACSPLVALFADDESPPASRAALEDVEYDLAESAHPTEELAVLLEVSGQHPRICEVSGSDDEAEPITRYRPTTAHHASADNPCSPGSYVRDTEAEEGDSDCDSVAFDDGFGDEIFDAV